MAVKEKSCVLKVLGRMFFLQAKVVIGRPVSEATARESDAQI